MVFSPLGDRGENRGHSSPQNPRTLFWLTYKEVAIQKNRRWNKFGGRFTTLERHFNIRWGINCRWRKLGDGWERWFRGIN